MFYRTKISPNCSATKQKSKIKNFRDEITKISTQVSPFSGIHFINEEYIKSGFSQLIDNQLSIRCEPYGSFLQ